MVEVIKIIVVNFISFEKQAFFIRSILFLYVNETGGNIMNSFLSLFCRLSARKDELEIIFWKFSNFYSIFLLSYI